MESDAERTWENERGAFLSSGSLSPLSRDLYEYNLRKFEAWCSSYGYLPLHVEPAQIFEYQRHLGKFHKPTTVSNEMGTVKRFFRFLVGRGVVDRNPAEEVAWATAEFRVHEVPGVQDLRRFVGSV